MTLDDLYFKAWRSGPNIGEHAPTLKLLATECTGVVEFGTNGAVSTTAILSAQPEWFTTIDKVPSPEAEKLKPFAGTTRFEVVQADSLTVEIEPCDLLLIDSLHTHKQLSAELERHAGRVKKWLLMHDVQTFGDVGEDGTRGLVAAITAFLADHREWRIVAEYRNSHGLTVLRRTAPGGVSQ